MNASPEARSEVATRLVAMRCFLAVLPPSKVTADIDSFLEPRRQATRQLPLRWGQAGRYHLTLAFMADYPEARVDELTNALDDWAARRQSLTMQLAGAGVFGSPDRAKVLYLKVPGAAAPTLAEWSAQLRALVTHHGGSPDGAGFIPHLTVARSNRGVKAGRILQALDTYESQPFEVTAIALVASRPPNYTHELVHQAHLGG